MKLSNLSKNKKYLLACSYGPDSMALFNLLLDGYNFDVAIVNYHLRKESNLEVDGLKLYCEKHDKKLYIYDVKEKIENNIESRCRNIRYNFFKSLFIKNGYDALLVAHHLDDHLETYLLQKKRKTLPKHWGISEKTSIFDMKVIRPLLSYTKQDIYTYCQENNVPFMVDSSNLNNEYERNKIRHSVIEAMSRNDKEKLCLEIEEENRKLDMLLSSIDINRINETDYLISLEQITYLYALNILIEPLKTSANISKKQGEEIRKVLLSEKPNVIMDFTKEVVFVKEYGRVYFLLKSSLEDDISFSYCVSEPSIIDSEYFYFDLSCGFEKRNIKLEDFPLSIRNAKKDDIVSIKNYEVEVRRLFIDWKMPITLRNRWPIILDKKGKIIYIPRYQRDFKIEDSPTFYVKKCEFI